jgi:hypothetical protein
MLSLFVTLEPPLPQPKVMRPKFESREDAHVLRLVQKWQNSVLPIDRRGKLNPTTIDLNGKTTLITRYIRAQAPPDSVDTIEKAIAFVSMIPFLEDRTALSASVDLWSTSDQMLEIGAGDEAEHAILLCNYFLHFNLRAWVVLGMGVPEGKAAYVLVEERDNLIANGSPSKRNLPTPWSKNKNGMNGLYYILVNPLNGIQYAASDPNCSLTEVHCVFDDKNVSLKIHHYLSMISLFDRFMQIFSHLQIQLG